MEGSLQEIAMLIANVAGHSDFPAVPGWENRPHADACSWGTQP